MTRCLALLAFTAAAFANSTDWPSYGNDPGAMRYSALRQIHAGNVGRLKLAWTFRTGKPGSEAIPIVVNDVMYFTAPDGVYALVPETGELLWKYDAAPMALRGLAYWPGAGGLQPRVFAGNGHFLLAVDVVTGKPAPEFGNEGRVDLKKACWGISKTGGMSSSRRRPSSTMWSLRDAAMARVPPARGRTATFAAGTPGRAGCCGLFTPSRTRANQGWRPGLQGLGNTDRA